MGNKLLFDLTLVYNNTVMTNLYGKKIMKHLYYKEWSLWTIYSEKTHK